MKKLLAAICLVIFAPAFSQSNLPLCQGANVSEWTNCYGRAEYANDVLYEGEWKDGNFHGHGAHTYSDGSQYVGEWRDSYFHGRGVFTEVTVGGRKERKEGVWEKNVLVRSEPIPDYIAGRTPTKEPPVGKDNETATNIDQAEDQTPSITQAGNEKVQVRNEKRIALVIGNASYKSAPLDNPLNDATDIANELKRRGFKVITRNNANLRSLQQAVRDFSDEFKKSDIGLIYYSGHGVETKGQNYLIPVDADIKKEYELSAQAYPASQLTEMMEEVQSSDDKKRVAILILDACRDNPLTRSWRSSGRGLARMDAPAGTFISFSTSPGSVASDGRGRNSPFTKHLLQAMRKPNVPIELMFKEVRVGVMGETKGEQIPWDSSSLTGDFYFSRSEKR